MEEIRWIETPKCCECNNPLELKNRKCCIGCDKLIVPKKKEKRSITHIESKESQRQKRNALILEMRKRGESYSAIAEKLKIPRATVQSAMAAVLRKSD